MNKKLNILAIFPHPDDSVLYAGASLSKWIQEGHKVSAVCCTDGEVGTLRTDLTKDEVSKTRLNELLEASKIIGVENLEILHHPDGGIMDIRELRKDLFRCVRKYKPNRVLSMDPWVKYEIHPDHRMVGRMSAEAAVFACFPLLYPEQLDDEIQPHAVSDVWFMGMLGHKPNCFVDVSSTIGKKAEALLKFETTMSIIADIFGSKADQMTLKEATYEWIRARAKDIGRPVDLAAAEAFYALKCLPGHFDNMQQTIEEMPGEHSESPVIC